MRTLGVLSLLAFLASGCSWQTDGTEPPSNLPVAFTGADYETTTFSVEAGEGVIVVRDRTVTGVCHRREGHGAYLSDGIVLLWLAHTGSTGGACPAIAVLDAYEATIMLEPGTYLLRVEYIGSIDTDTYPRPELEVEVEVL